MYNGIISSFSENNFKYNIKLETLPFHVLEKIKNEVYSFTDSGTRKTIITLESEQEILYLKANQVYLVVEYKDIKTKINLKNVTIKKLETDTLYELEFKHLFFL